MDKLFKDKLENHSIPPAPQSWEKVEARISKKNNLAIVLRAAAGIALLGLLLTFIFSQREQTATPSTLASKDIKSTPSTKSNDVSKTPVEPNEHVANAQPKKTRILPQREEVEKKIVEPEATQGPELVVNVISDSRPTVLSGSRPTASSGLTTEPAKTRRMVLVYTLPSVGKKVEATVPAVEEKKTGLQKVMDVAIEVRNIDPLGELREAKDEFFALEFRKDKKSKN